MYVFNILAYTTCTIHAHTYVIITEKTYIMYTYVFFFSRDFFSRIPEINVEYSKYVDIT